MNCLVIGNNPKHAALFRGFCENVYILMNCEYGRTNRFTEEINNFRVISFKDESVLKNYFHKSKIIKKIIQEEKISIVFTNTKNDLFILKKACRGLKNKPIILCTFHSSYSWNYNLKTKLFVKYLDKNVDGFVCLAGFVVDIAVKYGFSEDKILYLPNVVDYLNFYPKTDFSLNNNKVSIFSSAVVKKPKNQLELIEIINTIMKKHEGINIMLHFFGEYVNDEYYRAIQQYIKDNELIDNVIFHGVVDNYTLRKILPTCDIYTNSSICEMSPYNILEAKATKLPIFASKINGHTDLIQDGFSGLLFPLGDLKTSSEMLYSLITNQELREKLANEAYTDISTKNNVANSVAKLKDFVYKISKNKAIF